ncbi:carbohydrate kinase family protein [bacterium]|nr:carbohydrate kinase family protein [bacterium]
MKNILVSGSLAYDNVMTFPGRFREHIQPDKLHVLSVSFQLDRLEKNYGGTAGNIAYNLALLGLRPTVLAAAGQDSKDYIFWLRKHKVDVGSVKIARGKTASANIVTDRDHNQITGFYPGALFQSTGVPANSILKKSKLAIISPGNIGDMVKYAAAYRKAKLSYIIDPGQVTGFLSPGQLRQVISGAKVLIGNDYEMTLISKRTGWSLSQLLKKSDIVVTTLGAKGSIIQEGSKKIKVSAVKPKKMVDPTGAGDAYRAGLIYGILNDLPLLKTGQIAGTVAVHAVERYGTQNHSFTLASIKRRCQRAFSSLSSRPKRTKPSEAGK